jgi:putative tributyrin esterase
VALLDIQYYSEALGKQQKAKVILPQAPGPYHVLFQLHGLSDDETAWTRWTNIERHVFGLPLIVVMPDGGRGFYCDAEEGFAYGTAIGKELPELIDQWLPTKPGWANGGLSMGGYGCMRLALTYSERFISAASHSGALGFGRFVHRNDPEFGKEMVRIYGQDPLGGPNDLFALIEKADPRPSIYVDCGEDDFLIESNRDFNRFLVEKEIEHSYTEYPGDHNWAYWEEHFPKALAFHRAKLGF